MQSSIQKACKEKIAMWIGILALVFYYAAYFAFYIGGYAKVDNFMGIDFNSCFYIAFYFLYPTSLILGFWALFKSDSLNKKNVVSGRVSSTLGLTTVLLFFLSLVLFFFDTFSLGQCNVLFGNIYPLFLVIVAISITYCCLRYRKLQHEKA